MKELFWNKSNKYYKTTHKTVLLSNLTFTSIKNRSIYFPEKCSPSALHWSVLLLRMFMVRKNLHIQWNHRFCRGCAVRTTTAFNQLRNTSLHVGFRFKVLIFQAQIVKSKSVLGKQPIKEIMEMGSRGWGEGNLLAIFEVKDNMVNDVISFQKTLNIFKHFLSDKHTSIVKRRILESQSLKYV